MASICLGILLGSLVSSVVKHNMSHENFESFGWRLPFLFGIFVLLIGQYIRKHVHETPLFKEIQTSHKVENSPLSYVLKHHKKDMLVSIAINATGSVIFYLQAIYAISYFKTNRNFGTIHTDYLLNFCYFLMAFVTVFSGWLSDKLGRVKVLSYVTTATLVFSPFILYYFEYGDFIKAALAQVILAILAAAFIGPEPALQAEFYPTKIRNTALSLSYNVATSIFGGTTPLIIEYFVQNTNSIISANSYIVPCCMLSLLGLMHYRDRSALNNV